MRGSLRLEHDRLAVSCEGVCPERTLCGTVYAVLFELETLEIRGTMFGESRQLSFRCSRAREWDSKAGRTAGPVRLVGQLLTADPVCVHGGERQGVQVFGWWQCQQWCEWRGKSAFKRKCEFKARCPRWHIVKCTQQGVLVKISSSLGLLTLS